VSYGHLLHPKTNLRRHMPLCTGLELLRYCFGYGWVVEVRVRITRVRVRVTGDGYELGLVFRIRIGLKKVANT